MIKETSTFLRTLETTSSHVELDIVDASDNYKFYQEYDKLYIDSSIPQKRDFKIYRPDTHLYVDSSTEITAACNKMISDLGLDKDGHDHTKFRY